MFRLHAFGLALLLSAGSALAQYPARGQPDPSFHGGRPWVLPNVPAATNHTHAFAIQPLSGTRFAVAGTRAGSKTDVVMIVDTVPERVTTFDALASATAQQAGLWTLAPLGGALLVGGYVVDANNKQYAALEVREVGVGVLPRFDARATILSASTDAAYPVPITTAAFALASGSGTRVWQMRTRYSGNYACSIASLQRLDYVPGRFTERHQVDLSAGLPQPCMFPLSIQAAPFKTGDPAGSDALIVGGACSDAPGTLGYACFARVLDTGSALLIDRNYGTNGIARFYGATDDDVLRMQDMKVDAEGNLFGAAFRVDAQGRYSAIAFKVGPAGALDSRFGNGGSVLVASGGGNGAIAGGIALTPGKVVQVVGYTSSGPSGSRPYIAYLDAATGAGSLTRIDFTAQEPDYYYAEFLGVAPLPGGGALAVGSAQPTKNAPSPLIARLAGDRQTVDLLEYHHAGFDHYFVASVPEEIRKLDDGTFVGWQRTGESFAALPTGAAGAFGVCRFFSATFAPRSSHFYTPLADECAGLKAGEVWGYEGLVFALQIPSAAGACPAGTRPLYRLYNNGQGGAPNHRYTVSDSLRLAQLGQGWIGEGSGTPPVFACAVL